MEKLLITNPLAKALSYSADSNAADRKSKTGIFPFSVYVFNCDFSGTDLIIKQKKKQKKNSKQTFI